MRDQWTRIVSECLAGLDLPEDERHEVIEEVAAHLQECADDIAATGVTDVAEVTDRALAQVSDWPKLASQIRRAKELRMSPTGVDALDRRPSTSSRRLLASLMTATVLVGAAAGFLTATLTPARYRSQAVIQATPSQVSDNVVPVASTAQLSDRVLAIGWIVLSRARVERVIADFNLYSNERVSRTMEEVVEEFRRDVSMRVQAAPADSFTISYTGADPTIVMKVTERLAAEFTQPDSMESRQIGQQFKLTEPARWPDHPMDPMRARYAGFGALTGLGVGVLVALGMTIGRHWSSKRSLTQTA